MWETGRSVSRCNMLTNSTGEVNLEKLFSSYIVIPQTPRNPEIYNKLFRKPRHSPYSERFKSTPSPLILYAKV